MICPKCGSSNVSIQTTTTEKAKARHGIVYWIFIGWWLHFLLWVYTMGLMFIWRIIRPNRKTKTVAHTYCTCQNCGYAWKNK